MNVPAMPSSRARRSNRPRQRLDLGAGSGSRERLVESGVDGGTKL